MVLSIWWWWSYCHLAKAWRQMLSKSRAISLLPQLPAKWKWCIFFSSSIALKAYLMRFHLHFPQCKLQYHTYHHKSKVLFEKKKPYVFISFYWIWHFFYFPIAISIHSLSLPLCVYSWLLTSFPAFCCWLVRLILHVNTSLWPNFHHTNANKWNSYQISEIWYEMNGMCVVKI